MAAPLPGWLEIFPVPIRENGRREVDAQHRTARFSLLVLWRAGCFPFPGRRSFLGQRMLADETSTFRVGVDFDVLLGVTTSLVLLGGRVYPNVVR